MFGNINILEQELFKLLEYSFIYAEERNFPKLSVAIEAMKQLDSEYCEITKKKFINPEAFQRLIEAKENLRKTFDKDQKELNELTKKNK